MRSRVRSNSPCVSPGNPTMMSVERARPGTRERAYAILERYSSIVYPRRILDSTAFDPDWTGRCRYLQITDLAAMRSAMLFLKCSGWDVVNRSRFRPGVRLKRLRF